MNDQSRSSRLQVLFEAALQDYQNQTGIALDKHPLADELQNCASVESITVVLCEQTHAFNEFRGNDKVLKPLKKAVTALYKLSAAANFGHDIGVVRLQTLTWCKMSLTLIRQHFPPVTAIHTGLGVLLSVCAFFQILTAYLRDI
jgi:hypothetical protein